MKKRDLKASDKAGSLYNFGLLLAAVSSMEP